LTWESFETQINRVGISHWIVTRLWDERRRNQVSFPASGKAFSLSKASSLKLEPIEYLIQLLLVVSFCGVRKIGREADYPPYLFECKEMLEPYLHFRTNLRLENCALLDYCRASGCNLSPTFWDNLSVLFSRVKICPIVKDQVF
jgi:hypothetical protein